MTQLTDALAAAAAEIAEGLCYVQGRGERLIDCGGATYRVTVQRLETLAEIEAEAIRRALDASRTIDDAAKLLRIPRRTLQYRMRELSLRRAR
jgi:DNA-binding NtrC family response regulator